MCPFHTCCCCLGWVCVWVFLRLYAFSRSHKPRVGAESLWFVFLRTVPWIAQVCFPPSNPQIGRLAFCMGLHTICKGSLLLSPGCTQGADYGRVSGWGTWNIEGTHWLVNEVSQAKCSKWIVSRIPDGIHESLRRICIPLMNSDLCLLCSQLLLTFKLCRSSQYFKWSKKEVSLLGSVLHA